MTRRDSSLVVGGLAAAAVTARAVVRRMRAYELRDRVVLITGGSRGLGLVLARQLIARGARVAICARDRDELARAHRELTARGGRALAVPCDVTDPAEIARLVATVRAELGPIDVAIHNAGVIQVGPMELMTPGDYEEAMRVHFWAALWLASAVIPEMRARGAGRIVHITSIGGKIATPHLLPYTASKFALVGLSEGMRAELAKTAIRVTTVVPGLMRTGSPPHARFKGKHRAEYAWFAIGDSLPGASMSAERAARRIVEAIRYGEPEVLLSLPARLAVRLHGLAPGLTQRVLAIVDRLLPRADGAGTASVEGKDSASRLAPSWLTRATYRAARRNNEL